MKRDCNSHRSLGETESESLHHLNIFLYDSLLYLIDHTYEQTGFMKNLAVCNVFSRSSCLKALNMYFVGVRP